MAANGVECSAFLTKGTVPVVSPIPPFATTGTVPSVRCNCRRRIGAFSSPNRGIDRIFAECGNSATHSGAHFLILSAIKIPRSGSELRSSEGGSSDSEIHHFWHHYLVGFAFAQPNLRTSTQSTNLHPIYEPPRTGNDFKRAPHPRAPSWFPTRPAHSPRQPDRRARPRHRPWRAKRLYAPSGASLLPAANIRPRSGDTRLPTSARPANPFAIREPGRPVVCSYRCPGIVSA